MVPVFPQRKNGFATPCVRTPKEALIHVGLWQDVFPTEAPVSPWSPSPADTKLGPGLIFTV